METRAVIDVGTNSVKLLVATVSRDQVHPILEESKQTRLGQGFYETHLLQAEAIEKTAEAVSNFVKAAREWNPSSIRIIATSAARDALNKEALLSALQVASGVEVQIITGEQEADWAFRGVCTGGGLSGQTILVMDVGGGSTDLFSAGETILRLRRVLKWEQYACSRSWPFLTHLSHRTSSLRGDSSEHSAQRSEAIASSRYRKFR